MSAYGYERPTSPRIAEWGARGRFFERAYSEGTNTGQTFASMQRSATRAALYDDARPTMFRILRDAGYVTAQVNARRDDTWLDGGMWADYRRVILDGVDAKTHQKGKPLWDADKVTDEAIEYLSSIPADARHATWVHYLDPHAPRKKMAPFDFGDSDSDKYDTEVAFADREVGRLLDWMRDTGRLENTIVVLMADHGESFGEHGMVQHGNRPYDEQSHVPLVVWAPGIAPSRVATPVSTLDIAPTVLAYLGQSPIPGAEGVDLLGDVPARPIVVETPRNGVDVTFFAYAVNDGSWRLIYDVYGNTTELYDLASDPLELHNLADREPERCAALRAALARWLDATDSVGPLVLSADEDEGHE
jgi:arylsulfatase A-like enzyme